MNRYRMWQAVGLVLFVVAVASGVASGVTIILFWVGIGLVFWGGWQHYQAAHPKGGQR